MTRTFARQRVPRAALERVTRSIGRAPSAAYAQGQRLIIVTERKRLNQIAELAGPYAPWLGSASAIVVVATMEQAYRRRFSYGNSSQDPWPVPFWFVDAGAAVMLLLLAAADNGLGAGALGLPANGWSPLRELLCVPEDVHLVVLIALGYPASDPDEARTTDRLCRGRIPLKQRIHWEAWPGVPYLTEVICAEAEAKHPHACR
jgi:FMN reductase [NAD(P)H]